LTIDDPGAIRETEGELRIEMAHRMRRLRDEQELLGPQDLENLPRFDLGDQDEWMQGVHGHAGNTSAGEKVSNIYRRVGAVFHGAADQETGASERTCLAGAAIGHAERDESPLGRDTHSRSTLAAVVPAEGESLKSTDGDIQLVQEHLFHNPRVVRGKEQVEASWGSCRSCEEQHVRASSFRR
jgi:hypothetical protein